jgi:predicted nucleic acid-binding Zn ribbon protein
MGSSNTTMLLTFLIGILIILVVVLVIMHSVLKIF